ncbi:MAG: ribbon-helix-helix protein, CopG family [Spirulinaceae cyanobacterium]
MAQVNVTITEAEAELLEKLCEETGRTKSGLISEWTKQGLYKEIENRNKSYIWLSQRKKRGLDSE